MDEFWLDIPGFEGRYEASSLGRIRMVEAIGVVGGIDRSGYVLLSHLNHSGYPCVAVRAGAKKAMKAVHSLIALAFYGPRPAEHEVRHLDGCKTNAAPDNPPRVQHG